MSGRKRSFLNEPDDPDWDRAWGSMQNRTVADVSALNLGLDPNLGQPLTATISEAPAQYIDYLYLPTEDCVLCSDSTDGSERLPTSVNIQFHKIKGNIGFCAWAHRLCFEKLKLSDKPPPIPW